MGLPVLVLGYSGSGKSASLRNFAADEAALVNVNGKPLPFRTRFTNTLNSDNYAEISRFIKAQTTKVIVIDDTQYLMANEFMRRAKETGFQKFTDIGKNFWDLIKLTEKLPSDTIIYFLNHLETGEDGRQKSKTIGKLLDEKITVEGMFTTVLKTVVNDGKYLFATQTDGGDTCKSPIGLFNTMYIPNDLKAVDQALRVYYGMVEQEICSDCGQPLMPAGERTVQMIAENSLKMYGRKLCWACVMKQYKMQKEAKENAAKTVSDGPGAQGQ